MTTESRYRIELDDVKRVSFECRECHGVYAITAEGRWPPRDECPNPSCKTVWFHQHDETHKAVLAMSASFDELTRHKNDLKFILRLEVTPPDAKG